MQIFKCFSIKACNHKENDCVQGVYVNIRNIENNCKKN